MLDRERNNHIAKCYLPFPYSHSPKVEYFNTVVTLTREVSVLIVLSNIIQRDSIVQ